MFIETMGTAENTIGKQVMSNVRFADNNPPWKGRTVEVLIDTLFLGKASIVRYFDVFLNVQC